jgi:capsular exopolysaccharide synthesis family protein
MASPISIAKREYTGAPPGVRNAIQTLRTNIRFSSIDNEIKTLAVTSTIPDEGKSTISLFLAFSMAESGKKTLLIDADCRKPTLGNKLGKRSKRSWVDLLYNDLPVDQAISLTDQNDLYFLNAEPQLANPVEAIASYKFVELIEKLKKQYDVIIFDTPPLGTFIEAALLASKCDGTILVISSGKVDGPKVQEVMAQLKKVNAKILGAVLNKVNMPESDYYRNYHYKDGIGKNKYFKKRVETPNLQTADSKPNAIVKQ